MPKLPTRADFPENLYLTIIPAPNNKPATNILILLHGLGDSEVPFSILGSRFNFQETACLSIRGTTPLPFDSTGFHWGDDLIFDNSTGGLDMDSGFERTRAMFAKLIDETLIAKFGWSRRALLFFGYGQGGMVALDVASRLSAKGEDAEFGGVVSIGGPLPHSAPSPAQKAKTPVLIFGAEKNSAITDASVARVNNVFETVNVVRWKGRNGDGMMENAEETRPMMEFFSRRLKSRVGVPEGAIEIC